MAGLDFKAPESREQEDATIVAHNTRVGLMLFAVYVAFYGGFMGLSAFWPAVMSRPFLAGANLAVVYGFALIAAAMNPRVDRNYSVEVWLDRVIMAHETHETHQTHERPYLS